MPRPDRYLWLLPEHAVDRFGERIGGVGLLTAEETGLLARKRSAGARRRYLGARLLCRHALSHRTGRPPHSWRFRRGEHGRPEPDPPGDGVRFNLSHTGGLIACVVTHGSPCGVDVERTPAREDAMAHLPRFFAPAERAALAAAAPGRRAALVAAYWVLKEAYLKAIGTGLRRELSGFAFTTPWGGPLRVVDSQATAAADARWHFDLIHPSPGHVLAVAVENGRPDGLRRITLTG